MLELCVNNLKKYLDSTQIFEKVSFNIYDKEKVGIVGENGCGKSTLLKLISGKISINSDDKGEIYIPRNAKIGYLEQIPSYDPNIKVKEVLNLAFKEILEIECEMKNVEKEITVLKDEQLEKALKRYSRIQELYESKGGYDREERLSKVCEGLKIDEHMLNNDFGTLSGGEKTTVVLGKILLENPDILLLDEPTNHLDMQSCEWLEDFLKRYKGMVIIVSHDRYFLDNVVSKIIEIEDKISTTYQGNYSSYEKQKEENILIQFNNFKEQQKKIAAMKKSIKDLRDWGARADNPKFFKKAKSIEKALERMDKIENPNSKKLSVKLNFNETDRSGNEVIKVKGLYKKYGNKELFEDAELLVRYKERVALIGENGSGKTTFLKMLLQQEEVDSGEILFGENIKHAYLPQNIEFIDEEATILQEFRRDFNILEGKAREYLSKFMFFGSDVFKKIKHLSGGERIRLKLSELLYNDINVLVLDEPTNHLDINSIKCLEDALINFKGTIFFISHDRYFLNKISTRIVELEDKKFSSYIGNYDEYKIEKAKIKHKKDNKVDKVNKKWQQRKEQQREKRKLETRKKSLEQEVESLEKELKVIEEKMAVAGSDYELVAKLSVERDFINEKLENTINQWVEM